MKAINPKNQAIVNRAINWLIKHNDFNNKRDIIEGEFGEGSKQWRAINKKCMHSFGMFEELMDELPKNQRAAILKSDIY